MSSKQTGFFDNLVAAVRENPLAGALIGGGAVWLMGGDEKLKSAARSAMAAASPMVDVAARNVRAATSELRATAAPPTAPEMDHDGFAARSGDTTSQISDAISGAASKIKDRFEDGAAYARENLGQPGKEAFIKAQSSLADMLERQPLVLGVVGLAIGAAIAGAFQPSDKENEWIGELSDDVKADLNTRAGAVSQVVREGSDTLKGVLSDTATEAVDRVTQAGMDVAAAAREKVNSP